MAERPGTRHTVRAEQVCPRCRRRGERVDPPGWPRLRRWLVDGDRRPRLRCDNGHAWVAGARSVMYAASPANLPGRLVRVVLHRRAAQPNPAFMLGAAAAGLALGIVLELALGWRWWLVALLSPVVVWLGFLATALSRRVRGGLLAQLVGEVDHRRGDAMDGARLRMLLESAPSPPLGLAGWEGPRAIGGRSVGDAVGSVELVHGDRQSPPYLSVTTTWRAPGDRLPSRRDLAPPGRHRWQTTTLPVGGVTRPFTWLPTPGGWVARAQLPDVVIEVVAAGVPLEGTVLEPVTDLTAYD